jgi:hypothetical protein
VLYVAVIGGIGAIITGTISGVMPAELWLFYFWTVLGGLVMVTALGDLGGSTSAVICVTLGCTFAFVFWDRWISCSSDACKQGDHGGMPEGWLPPVVDNATATCVWGFVLL